MIQRVMGKVCDMGDVCVWDLRNFDTLESDGLCSLRKPDGSQFLAITNQQIVQPHAYKEKS
jgi:hypothetical protein